MYVDGISEILDYKATELKPEGVSQLIQLAQEVVDEHSGGEPGSAVDSLRWFLEGGGLLSFK